MVLWTLNYDMQDFLKIFTSFCIRLRSQNEIANNLLLYEKHVASGIKCRINFSYPSQIIKSSPRPPPELNTHLIVHFTPSDYNITNNCHQHVSPLLNNNKNKIAKIKHFWNGFYFMGCYSLSTYCLSDENNYSYFLLYIELFLPMNLTPVRFPTVSWRKTEIPPV